MPGLSRKKIDEAIALVEDALLEGFRPPGVGGPGRGAIQRAAAVAVARGIADTKGAFQTRVYKAKLQGFEPDWTKYRNVSDIISFSTPTPTIRIDATPEAMEPDGEPKRVLVIGDAHCDPRVSNERFTWLGRLIAERQPEHVLQIGDMASMDSVSSHEKPGTTGYAARPSIDQDFDCLRDALSRIERERPAAYKPKYDVTLGNHEHRVHRFEEQRPELGQHLSLRLDEIFAQYGWRTRAFGSYRYINGVGFVHHPINGMGKAFGGVTGAQRAGASSLISIVSGHTHKRDVVTLPKIGGSGKVEMVSVGCFLPHGHVEMYARTAPTGWWYGAVEMVVQGGEILDMDWISMLTLRARYSDAGGDVRSAA